MAYPPLVYPSDVADFPGAPFADAVLESAGASVRAEAGWHIAPTVTETLQLNSWGDYLLRVPSLRIVTVTAVRSGLVSYTDYTLYPDGLYRGAGWPVGVVEVDLTHGFDVPPAELLPIVVQRVKSASVAGNVSQRSTTTGPFSESETYRDPSTTSTLDPVVARYSVNLGIG